MTARIKRAILPAFFITALAGIVGYILGSGDAEREVAPAARAAEVTLVAQNTSTAKKPADVLPAAVSPVGTVSERDVYYPGTDGLAPNEVRVVCCGSDIEPPK